MAAAGALSSDAGRRAAAAELLADPRGAARIEQFHAFWLATTSCRVTADMAPALRAETDALVARVVFERRGDYFDLFNATETFVNDTLATHYGLPRAGQRDGRVGALRRPARGAGILSHGTLLAAGAKFDDTSPTLRGMFVRNRLLCQTIPPPPPNVDVDEPPPATGSPCKVDRYAAHARRQLRGLPQPDRPDRLRAGELRPRPARYRAADEDNPQCTISGDGERRRAWATFNGPAELATLIAGSGSMESCVVTQLYPHGARPARDARATCHAVEADRRLQAEAAARSTSCWSSSSPTPRSFTASWSRRRHHGAQAIHADERCCGARAARRSRCRRSRSCSTATASRYAQAMTIPKRYLVCFGGQSLGGDNDPLHNDYVPNTVGANYDLKSALAPLAPRAGRRQRGLGALHPDRATAAPSPRAAGATTSTSRR